MCIYILMEAVIILMELIVLMPFFNEEKQIPITIDRLIPLLDPLKIEYSLLLVDDGSKDGVRCCVCSTLPLEVRRAS